MNVKKNLDFDHGYDYSHNVKSEMEDFYMETISASEFKTKCLHLMDEVNRTGKEIVITKNGKPVSILKPYRTIPKSLFGIHKGKVHSNDSLIAPLDITWDAEQC